MLKKVANILLSLVLATSLVNCAQSSVNTADIDNTKPVSLNIDIKNLSQQDITALQIDGKSLAKSEYSINTQELILPKLSIGRHVLKISHKTFGQVEIPLEIKKDSNNNFQFTPLILNQKIQSWEAGIDENKDGLIDKGSYFSKDFQTYVVVRDTSGKLNYLPKNNLSSDFRENLNPEKPANFNFPDLNENELKSSDTQVIANNNVNQASQSTNVKGDLLDFPFPGNTALNLENSLNNIKGYKVSAITSDNILFPVSTYLIKNNYLILDNYTYKDQKVLKLYLKDEADKNYMLKIDILNPFINKSPDNQPNMAPPNNSVQPNNPPPPQGQMPPPNPTNQNQISDNNSVSGTAPEPDSNGKPRVDYLNSSNVKFTVFTDVSLTEEEFKKLTIYEVVVNPPPPPAKIKKVYITLPDNNGYAEINNEGIIINYFSEKDFKPEADATILPAKK